MRLGDLVFKKKARILLTDPVRVLARQLGQELVVDSGSHGGEGTRHHTQRLTEPLGLLPRFPLLVKLVAAAFKKLPCQMESK